MGWEAIHYAEIGYSRSVQCREDLLREARDTGWAVAEARRLRSSRDEVRVAFTPGNLLPYLHLSRKADQQELAGKWREAFFLAQTPNAPRPLPKRLGEPDEAIEQQRQRIAAARWARHARFSAMVKHEYEDSCAICRIQLEIVEGAHIIPVREHGSRDEVWNGIALCPNHHELFDGSAFVVGADLRVRVDDARIEYLRENDRARGIEILTDYRDESIRLPHFWENAPNTRDRMIQALARRTLSAGLS